MAQPFELVTVRAGISEPLSRRAREKARTSSRVPPRHRGRPKWQPSKPLRLAVREAASRGLQQDLIAALVGVSESTLKRRCADELHFGAMMANAQMALTAYDLGVSGKDPIMTRWWLRVRAGWRDMPCRHCGR